MGRIIKDMQSYLANQKYLEHSLKNWVGLKSITDYSANVYVIVHTNMQGSREFGKSVACHLTCSNPWIFAMSEPNFIRGFSSNYVLSCMIHCLLHLKKL